MADDFFKDTDDKWTETADDQWEYQHITMSIFNAIIQGIGQKGKFIIPIMVISAILQSLSQKAISAISMILSIKDGLIQGIGDLSNLLVSMLLRGKNAIHQALAVRLQGFIIDLNPTNAIIQYIGTVKRLLVHVLISAKAAIHQSIAKISGMMFNVLGVRDVFIKNYNHWKTMVVEDVVLTITRPMIIVIVTSIIRGFAVVTVGLFRLILMIKAAIVYVISQRTSVATFGYLAIRDAIHLTISQPARVSVAFLARALSAIVLTVSQTIDNIRLAKIINAVNLIHQTVSEITLILRARIVNAILSIVKGISEKTSIYAALYIRSKDAIVQFISQKRAIFIGEREKLILAGKGGIIKGYVETRTLLVSVLFIVKDAISKAYTETIIPNIAILIDALSAIHRGVVSIPYLLVHLWLYVKAGILLHIASISSVLGTSALMVMSAIVFHVTEYKTLLYHLGIIARGAIHHQIVNKRALLVRLVIGIATPYIAGIASKVRSFVVAVIAWLGLATFITASKSYHFTLNTEAYNYGGAKDDFHFVTRVS